MGSSFEDLIAISPAVKTDLKSDKPFDLQNIFKFRISHLMLLTAVPLYVELLHAISCRFVIIRDQ